MEWRKRHKACPNRSDALLLDELTTACVRRGGAVDRGDTTTANEEFDRAMQAARELLSRGRPAADGILSLLSHENPYVRKEAAFLALEIDPQQGEQVLEELSRSYTVGNIGLSCRVLDIGFTARFTLEQWRTGKLKTLSQWRHSTQK